MHIAYRIELIATIFLVIAVGAGCSSNTPTTKTGVPWWPQGPGNPADVVDGEYTDSIGVGEKVTESPAADTQTVAQNSAPVQASSVAQSSVAEASTVAAAAAGTPAVAAATLATASVAVVAPAYARYGDLLFVSGQIADQESGVMPATVDAEARSVMSKVQGILTDQHLTMTNIVSATIFLTSLDDWKTVEASFNSYFKSAMPAYSTVEVRRLPGGARIQISVIAGR